jgi:hypothetical protein
VLSSSASLPQTGKKCCHSSIAMFSLLLWELSMLLCGSITTRWGNNVIVPLLTLPKSLIASMMYNHSATPGVAHHQRLLVNVGNQGLHQL